MEVKLMQSKNKIASRLVMLSGSVIEDNPAQLQNAPCPMLIILLGMEIEVKPEEANAFSPIFVILLGMDIEVKLEHL